MIRNFLFACAALLATQAAAETPVEQLATPPADAQVWTLTSSNGVSRHGQVSLWTTPDGTHWSRFGLNMRGFVSEIDEANRFAPDGTLQSLVVRGKTPSGDAAETYEVKDGRYSFKSPVDHGEGAARAGLAYASFGGTFDSFLFLIDAMRKSPDHSIDLLPSGRGSIAPLTTLEVSNGKEKKTVTAYAIAGFGLSPFPIWMDGDKFFGVPGVVSILPLGWESAGAAMSKAQDEALARRAPAQLAAIARTPAGPVVFKNVKLFDADARKFMDGMTVVVADGRIADVGASAAIPAGAEIIDGTGRDADPRPVDNHQHYGDDSTGPLLLASGNHLGARSGQPAGRADGAQEAHRRRPAPRPAHRAVAPDRRRRALHRTGRRGRAQPGRSARRRAQGQEQGAISASSSTARSIRPGSSRWPTSPTSSACTSTATSRTACVRSTPCARAMTRSPTSTS